MLFVTFELIIEQLKLGVSHAFKARLPDPARRFFGRPEARKSQKIKSPSRPEARHQSPRVPETCNLKLS